MPGSTATSARRGLHETVATGNSPVKALTQRGLVLRSGSAAGGLLRNVAEVLPGCDGGDVTARYLEAYPDDDLVERWEKSNVAPLVRDCQVERSFWERLTDDQHVAVELAE